jgi:hypothetical protein
MTASFISTYCRVTDLVAQVRRFETAKRGAIKGGALIHIIAVLFQRK